METGLQLQARLEFVEKENQVIPGCFQPGISAREQGRWPDFVIFTPANSAYAINQLFKLRHSPAARYKFLFAMRTKS
jgi:hypothetical protein